MFKSIHIDSKSALVLLESLDTTDIATNKSSSLNSNKKDNNNISSSSSYTVAGRNISSNIIAEKVNAKITNSTVNNENDRVIAHAAEKLLPVGTNNNISNVNLSSSSSSSSSQLKYPSNNHPSPVVAAVNNYCVANSEQHSETEKESALRNK